MCVQLNMFTINTNLFRILTVFTIWLAMGAHKLLAQESVVTPLSQSTLNPLQADIFVYAAGGTSKNGNLWTATNYINDKDVYGTFVDLGLKAEFYKQKLNGIRLGTSFGYKYQVYAYDKSLSGNSGVYSHWLTADLDFCLSYFNAGFKSDIFLSSKIKNNDHFSYEGLYSDCFNHISFCYYVGFNVRFTRLKLEARIGSYLVPQFSPEKISYHNMTKTHVDGSYFEIRVYYRIFTTGKVHSSPYMFD